MSDRLENFIRKNKKDFNDFEPPADLWERIEQKLNEVQPEAPKQPKKIRVSTVVRAAAIFLMFLTAGIVIWRNQQLSAPDLNDIDPQLAKQQIQYTSLIEEKQSELKRIQKENPQLYNEFSAEIKVIEENYQKLKKDLPESPNREETVKAMIRNLQIQIEVLNQQLKVIQQVDQFKKENQHETQSI